MTLCNTHKYGVYHFSRRKKLTNEFSTRSGIKNNNIRCLILDSRSNKKVSCGPFRSYHSLKRWILFKLKSSNALSNKLGWSYGHIKRSMDTKDNITYALTVKTPGNIFQLEGIIIAQSLLDEAELLFVFVRKASRRTGLGAFLLNNALRHLASTGTIDVFLEVARTNRVAALLYEKNFFRPVGTRTKYYKQGKARAEDAIVYRRTLSS
ncbi:MAG: hypothetical protein CMM15_03610 [Rhodospirillaceae bacterium]|nr:hypothetical protein [Rhodospirillaceae bacterium]OUU27937.1 MAG: hypothetical protein CBB97_05340 [Candidatus Endolissoclinum sp. TMED37]